MLVDFGDGSNVPFFFGFSSAHNIQNTNTYNNSRTLITHNYIDKVLYNDLNCFDVRVFHPNAQSYRKSSISSIYRHHELQKKRENGDRIREVESASFTPLVFSTTGGMGREGLTFYRQLLSRRDATTYSGIWHGFVALCLFHC